MRISLKRSVLVLLVAAVTGVAWAQSTSQPASQPASRDSRGVLDQLGQRMRSAEPKAVPTSQPATSQPADTSDSTQTMNELEGQLQGNPLIAPTQGPDAAGPRAPRMKLEVDPKVLGIAPGMEPPKLRREGDFVISRRGRLHIGAAGQFNVFIFEADGKTLSDPPMLLVPCQAVQTMEQLVQERGNRIVFILSGQVLEYRGTNLLMPTMMKLDIDRGNLQR